MHGTTDTGGCCELLLTLVLLWASFFVLAFFSMLFGLSASLVGVLLILACLHLLVVNGSAPACVSRHLFW